MDDMRLLSTEAEGVNEAIAEEQRKALVNAAGRVGALLGLQSPPGGGAGGGNAAAVAAAQNGGPAHDDAAEGTPPGEDGEEAGGSGAGAGKQLASNPEVQFLSQSVALLAWRLRC